jgi:hypothetical protein
MPQLSNPNKQQCVARATGWPLKSYRSSPTQIRNQTGSVPRGYCDPRATELAEQQWLFTIESSRLRVDSENVREGSATGVAARPRSSIAAMIHEAVKVFEENRAPTHI